MKCFYFSQIKTNAYKSIQCLEKDLNTLYQIELKYLTKYYNYNKMEKNDKKSSIKINLNSNESKYIDCLFNKTPIGLFKKSELGESMRLYYYLSPSDLIQYFKTTSSISNEVEIEHLIKHNIGSYLTISLNNNKQQQNNIYQLPDSSSLLLNENDESNWKLYLDQYIQCNNNLNFEK